MIFVALGVLFAIPLAIFGEQFDRAFVERGGVEWLRGFGAWAWAVGIGLLVADLVLPVPATPVMSALGILYGPIAGGLIGGLGSMLAGSIAYGLTRMLGRRAAVFLAGERDLRRSEAFFNRTGGWAVAVARPVPLLAEVIVCLAGLARMRPGKFFVALACGSLPMGMVFAALGHSGAERPMLALAISALAPMVLWPVARWMVGNRREDVGK
ncbi:MAG TPA: VTT domain-containing protein [Phycisphaerae bacterium]|nr:VTT domain-containing protein [Phycisphaerae bacterium]HOJ55383.1 VTT domain-containing protein [Phycisphaerae bacterium]HOL24931.1 VTT domain-containing protein [Phycisphaerae bacterium]HPP20033.1 VTT domain-containing protein [Phycisphaerae bacterium]HPU32458.1 VTT domain-containing protein [Phycisphaerae bacterium]